MIRALLEKEWRQHGLTFGFVLLLPFVGLVLLSTHGALRRAGGGGFEAVRLLLMFFVPLASIVLGQLLIAKEFRHKTQLFLEGLPLPRWRMLAVKFGLGFGLIGLVAALSLGHVGWMARHVEAMTPRFAALLACKTAGWVAVVYSCCFAHAFLGRYRIPFGIAIVCGLAYASSIDLPVSEFGPFALVDNRFAFERFVWPVKALVISGGLFLLLTSLGFYLGLVRDATVAAMLAEKMSSREKMFLTFLTVAALIVIGEVSQNRKDSTPVQMPGAAESDRAIVHVLATAAVDAPTSQETAVLQKTVNSTGAEFEALTTYLGCHSFPRIFIVHRRDLAGGDFIDGELKTAQGVLVRTNLLAPTFKSDALLAWLTHATLVAQTNGLSERERNAWVLDGFNWWWPRSQHGAISAWSDATAALRASAKPFDLSPQEMRTWFTVRKTLGEEQASMQAGCILAMIAERHGIAELHNFLADRLGRAEPVDARGWWRDMLRPTSTRLRAATGLSEEALVSEWHQALFSAR